MYAVRIARLAGEFGISLSSELNTPKAAVLCGRDTVQVRSESLKRIPKQELVKRLKKIGKVEANSFLLHIFYEDYRIVIFNDGRALCMEQMM